MTTGRGRLLVGKEFPRPSEKEIHDHKWREIYRKLLI
jgi:hypothetical protein